ncbi:MAG: NAD(P)-binding oxidoreductase [Fusicatenibacter sp.]|nr:SDR family oxidoreductase [Lachnospiraceae bacterium]MDY2937420.1 NAD(P)-binding oxidoreductase [Fusicatenibacter sp.]
MKITIFSFGGVLGQAVANIALANGDQVTLYLPDAGAVWPRKNLTVVEGSMTDRDRILEALLEADTVISVLIPTYWGHRMDGKTPTADGNAMIISAMEQLGKTRFVTLGHLCIHAFGDSSTSYLRFTGRIMQLVWPGIYYDMQKMGQVLTHSHLNWTLVRILPQRQKGKGGNLEISLDGSDCRGGISEEQLAGFLYEAAADQGKYCRKMPMVYNR